MNNDPVLHALINLVRAVEMDPPPIIYGPAYRDALEVIRSRVSPGGETAQPEAVQKDAERYRWLNKQHHFLLYVEPNEGERHKLRLRCGEPLDLWLDNRIKEEEERPTPQNGSPE
jgi:hypothetical protein